MLDLFDYSFRHHFCQCVFEGSVAIKCDVLSNIFRVDAAAVSQNNESLMFEESNVTHLRNWSFLCRRNVHQLFHWSAFNEVFFNEVRDIFFF